MKSQEFVNLLNENIKKIDSDEELLQWKYKENDYPYLDIKYNENIEQEYPKNIQTVTIKLDLVELLQVTMMQNIVIQVLNIL